MTDDRPDKRRVLVVDDEAPLRELIVVTLGDEFFCLEAADAEAALRLLEDEVPDIIFLDVMLPGRSGLELLEVIRATARLHEVPVVVVSAWQTPHDVARALESGADSFLPKPFRVEELETVVRSLLDDG